VALTIRKTGKLPLIKLPWNFINVLPPFSVKNWQNFKDSQSIKSMYKHEFHLSNAKCSSIDENTGHTILHYGVTTKSTTKKCTVFQHIQYL